MTGAADETLERLMSLEIEFLAQKEAFGALYPTRAKPRRVEKLSPDRGGLLDTVHELPIETLPKSRCRGHNRGTDSFQIFADSAEVGVVCADSHRDCHHLKDALIAMPDRKDGQSPVARRQLEGQILHLRRHIGVCPLNSLWGAGRPRGIDN